MQRWIVFYAIVILAHAALAQEPPQTLAPVAQFQMARALAITTLGEIFVLDGALSRLYKLDQNGQKIAHVGGFGIDREAFDNPLDLTTDGLNVFVADRGNQRVSQFDRNLNFVTLLQHRPTPITSLGLAREPATSAGQLWRPISLSLSGQGDLYILDEAQRQVIRINPLTFASELQQRQNPTQFQFGGFDAGAGNLIDPQCVQTSRSGKVFVSDRGAQAVFVYDLFGNFVMQIGKGMLHAPRALGIGLVPETIGGEKVLQEWLFVIDESALLIFRAEQETGFKFLGKITAQSFSQITNTEVKSLVDAAWLGETLYLLTEKALYFIPRNMLNLSE